MVERVVDRVLFRKRHEDEQALRAFAHEAAYFTDSTTLIHETQRVIAACTGVGAVTLSLDDGAGTYGIAPENDPAIVALRAWRKIARIAHSVGNALDLLAAKRDLSNDRFRQRSNGRPRAWNGCRSGSIDSPSTGAPIPSPSPVGNEKRRRQASFFHSYRVCRRVRRSVVRGC